MIVAYRPGAEPLIMAPIDVPLNLDSYFSGALPVADQPTSTVCGTLSAADSASSSGGSSRDVCQEQC